MVRLSLCVYEVILLSKHFFDFNKPITDNRDEVILIKLTGCLKNACELLFISALSNDYGYWKLRYPGFEYRIREEVAGTGTEGTKRVYYMTMKYTPKDFLIEMRKPKEPLSDEEIAKDLAKLMGEFLDPLRGSFTSLEMGIREIVKYDFCKSIIVYEPAISANVVKYLSHLFSGYESKVYTFEGFLGKALEEHPEVTTIFADDAEEVMKVMEYYEGMEQFDKLSEKQIFIEGMNAVIGKDSDGKAEFKYQQYMDEAKTRFNANVTWMTSHFIDLSDPMPGVDDEDLK